MPLYFFHLHEEEATPDAEGRDCADEAAALAVAIEEARSLAAVQVTGGRLNLGHRIEVEDESGRTVAVVRFGDAVTVEG